MRTPKVGEKWVSKSNPFQYAVVKEILADGYLSFEPGSKKLVTYRSIISSIDSFLFFYKPTEDEVENF